MVDLYEENFWNKIDFLHERFQKEYSHIANYFEMLTKFKISCSQFSDSIEAILENNYALFYNKNTSIAEVMDKFRLLLTKFKDSFKEIAGTIYINSSPIINLLPESIQKERDIYNIYIKHRSIYLNNKTSLQKIQNEFSQRAKECETLVYEAKKVAMFPTESMEQIAKMEKMASESLANTATIEDKYIQLLKETNKSRETEINTQKQLLNYYHKTEVDYNEKKKLMTSFFISSLTRMKNTLDSGISDYEAKFKEIDINNDINEFVKKNKGKDKPDEVIKFLPYKPATEISDESILNADVKNKSKDGKILEVSLEVILLFKKFFKFIRTDLDMLKERKKSKLRILTYKLFSPEDNIFLEENEKKELYTLFKEKNFTTFFLQILSRQRTKGYKKNPKVLDDLIEIFKYILDKAEKEKNLEEAISCVSMSQIYFCEQKENKSRKYILDGIRDNKWLSCLEFWDGVIDFVIQKELKKNEDINKGKNVDNKNIYFSQIFSYTNNMVEFNINKNEILPFVDNICKKYELNNDFVESIKMNIKAKFEEKDTLSKSKPKEKKEEYTMMRDINEINENEIENKDIKKDEEKKEKKEEIKKEEVKIEENKIEEVKKEENIIDEEKKEEEKKDEEKK